MGNPYSCTLSELAAAIPDGTKLAVPKDTSGVAMAATRELLRRKVKNLHLICVPQGGIQADILIGAGAVRTLETSAVSLGEFGAAPRFTEAFKSGAITMLDATCPAVYAGLQAAEKGIPFMPLRGIIGSDLLNHRTDWKVIDNPFGMADPIVVLPAIQPDVSLFHVSLADRYGNVYIGRNRELMTMAHAAKSTVVTAEEISPRNLLEDRALAGAVIPSIYISYIAEAKRGALPLGLPGSYGDDEVQLAAYARQARMQEGFNDFLRLWMDTTVKMSAVSA